jgi:hypothetical protein
MQKREKYFDRGMLSDGIIFFTFTLFGYSNAYHEELRTVVFSGQELFVIPGWLYFFYGTLTLILSIIFIIGTYNIKLSNLMKSLVDKPIGYIYWMYFLAVYIVTWYGSIQLVDYNESPFYLLVFVGTIFFMIIFVSFIKSVIKVVKWFKHFKVMQHRI